MSTNPAVIVEQASYFLHLVRVDDLEYYFIEIEDAIAKMKMEPDALYECITLH